MWGGAKSRYQGPKQLSLVPPSAASLIYYAYVTLPLEGPTHDCDLADSASFCRKPLEKLAFLHFHFSQILPRGKSELAKHPCDDKNPEGNKTI